MQDVGGRALIPGITWSRGRVSKRPPLRALRADGLGQPKLVFAVGILGHEETVALVADQQALA
jgi:hypothetical protein